MLLVLAFLVLFFALLAGAYSQLATSLRSETARVQQVQRDEGTTHALARGLALLETGYPPASPYMCAVTILTSTGPQQYTVSFELESPGNWSVRAAPTSEDESPAAMPTAFVSATPP
jgi:hypothetical protein